MTRNTSFGKTPWGQAWLRSLDKIDWENRLSRGATYARNGRVKSIKIQQNRIEAFVQGREYNAYRVGVVALPLQKRDITKLTKLIAGRSDLLSRILNRELPMELETLCEDAGIVLFPRSWKDLKLTCSCPDWAVPCKHLAAVLYLMANEIDKNPFMVFSLLGVELLDALSRQGYSTSALSAQMEVKNLLSIVHRRKRGRLHSGTFDTGALKSIDLSKIPKVELDLIEFLPDPVFYHNLRNILTTYYRRHMRHAERQQSAEPDRQAWVESIRKLEIVLDENGGLFTAYFIGWENRWDQEINSSKALISILQTIPAEQQSQICTDLQFCSLVHSAALQLLRNGAVLPEILQCPDGDFISRWIPAMQLAPVNAIIQSLTQIFPSHLLKWYIGEEEYFSTPVDGVISLFSLILGHYVQHWYLNPAKQDYFNTFLSSQTSYPFQEFSEREIPAAFQQWLSNLSFACDTHKPVITVSEFAGDKFNLTLDIETIGKNGHDIIPYADFIQSKKYATHRLSTMRMVSLVGNKLPVIHKYLREPDTEIELSGIEIIAFLEAAAPVMRLTHIRINLPKSLQHLVRPRTTGHFGTKQKSSGFFSLFSLLNFDWRIALGDTVITTAEFRKLLDSNSQLVRYRDQYIVLDEKEVAAILRRIEKPEKLSAPEMLRSVILGEYESARASLSQEVLRELNAMREITQLSTPDGLHATLRPYQLRGYAWLYKNAKLGLGSILADDMGLGKTLQVLTLLLKFKDEGALKEQKALVIAPATLLTNWQRECEKFAPALKTHIYHGASRSFQDADYDILFTTYGLIRQDQQALTKMRWAAIVIDEAQAIKNPSTAQAKAVHALKSPVKIAMSGTPVENRLMEYFSLFHFTNPGYLGTANHFKGTYANPIEKNRDQHSLDQFRRITEPFIMRRMKTDKSIISDLPDKTEMNRYCTLTKAQAALYASITKKIMKEIEESEGIERRGLVLQLLLKLKQVCNHPYNHLKSGSRDIALTGKGESLIEVINAIKEEGSKVLIFTQFKEMGDVLVQMLLSLGEEAFFLHGGLGRKSRDEMVSQFQEQPYPRVLILSIKAGGTGLNLTAATHVIHYDLWWNPAVERQATDRAFRIGQKHKVTVHRMITQHTLEEKIDALIQSKKELADLTVVSGEKWIGELSDKELKKLVELEG